LMIGLKCCRSTEYYFQPQYYISQHVRIFVSSNKLESRFYYALVARISNS